MQFKVNDIVQYSATGICKIIRTEKRQILEQGVEYYVLQPMFDRSSVVYVPIGNKLLVEKMHKVLSEDEIRELIRCVPDMEDIWIEDKQQRHEAYRALLHRGDRAEVLGLIKSLYLQGKRQQTRGKKLHIADDKLYKTAQRLLYDEFAFVLNISPSEVGTILVQKLDMKQ